MVLFEIWEFYVEVERLGFLNLHPALAVPVLSPSQVCVTCQDRQGITWVRGNVTSLQMSQLETCKSGSSGPLAVPGIAFVLREMKFRFCLCFPHG